MIDPTNVSKLLKVLGWPFDESHFGDLALPVGAAAVLLLIVAVVIYNVQTRRLRRHAPLVNREEWLLWTAICFFGLIAVEDIFHFYFFVVLLTLAIGLPTFLWIAFFKFPPVIEGYNQQLRRARFFSQSKYKHPEATLRTARKGGRPKRRRAR
jgi:hypothetical protein